MDDIRNSFPKEIIDLFLQYTEDKTKRSLRSTNKYWHSYIKLDEFTIYFANPKTVPDIVQHFLKYYENIPIGITLDKIVSEPDDFPFHHFARLTNLTSLQFNTFGSFKNLTNASELYVLTNLQKITPMIGTSAFTNLTTLSVASPQYLSLYTNLRHLDYNAQGTIDALSMVANPTRLTSLTISLSNAIVTKSDLDNITDFTNLKKLSVTAQNFLYDIKHLTNLESLEVKEHLLEDVGYLTRLTALSVTLYNGARNIGSLSQLKNLKVLFLSCPMSTDTCSFLSELTALEDFSLFTHQLVESGLQYLNSQKLTRLFVPRPINFDHLIKTPSLLELYVDDLRTNVPNCEALTCLKNLTKLDLLAKYTHSAIYTVLGQLETLKYLQFGEQPKYELHEDFTLKNLTNLEFLQLNSTASLTVYTDLCSLTRLTSLLIAVPGEVFLTNPTLLKQLPLRALIFGQTLANPGLEIELQQHINDLCTSLRGLEHLEVWGVDSEEFIGSLSVLTNLTRLEFPTTSGGVTGIYLTKLVSLQKLHFAADTGVLREKLTRLVSHSFW